MSRRYDAVLLDAFGTLFELDDPFRRMDDALREHLGAALPAAQIERGFRVEMAHYAEHCHTGGDPAALARLRLDCAALLGRELGLAAAPERLLPVLADAIRYRVFGDVAPALAGIVANRRRTAVVSNWDSGLPEVLAGLGLTADAIVDSASAGAAKPDPAVFALALERLGVDPGRALHVGDTPAVDGVGARAAGIDVRIIDRSRAGGPDTIASLTEILPLLA
jgi:putative hydrolase of the HAD superfamily